MSEAPAAVRDFVVTHEGRESFHDEASLRALAERGQLKPDDLVYHPLLGRWLYAREVEEVREALSRALVLAAPLHLGRSPRRGNPYAVAGFTLGLAGMVPFAGLLSALLGLYFSSRGLARARAADGEGKGLAIAGLALSIIFLLPAVACGALLLAASR